VLVWDALAGVVLQFLDLTGGATCLAVYETAQGGVRVVLGAGGGEGTIMGYATGLSVWDPERGQWLHDLDKPGDVIQARVCLHVLTDGDNRVLLVGGGERGVLRVWEAGEAPSPSADIGNLRVALKTG
jgi:hypothetical protein